MPLPKKNGKESFIAVNILPLHPRAGDPVAKLMEQVALAKGLGFTHAWINPISVVSEKTVCKRRCLDTGVHFDLTGSLYAPKDPKEIRPDFDRERIREMVTLEKEGNFFILVDFVWKHVSVNSLLIKDKPAWFGAKPKLVKDVVEYHFESTDDQFTPSAQEIIEHLKSSIDLLLDPVNGYGFAGLRVDAASQLSPLVRRTLYQHIRTQWPEAIIFEEVLFDSTESSKVALLVKDSKEHSVYSDFVTSNLYYQRPDCFGALPLPEQMGDALKLQLANQRGISFTGNHDHYSLGWSIVLTMAAQRLIDQDQLTMVELSVSPFKQYPFIKDFEKSCSIITNLAEGKLLIENLTPEEQGVIQYLVPFANTIVRVLLDFEHADHPKLFEAFRQQLLEKMSNRTLGGISGYFFLFSELSSPFETQRIFSNRRGEALACLFLTEEDLKSQLDLTRSILERMKKNKKEYDNFTNFEKNIPCLMKKEKKITEEKLVYELRICLPYILEYLRNQPEENNYHYQKQYESDVCQLNKKLDIAPFIEQINQMYGQLTTINSNLYHTFVALDCYKIFVRCLDDRTDVIILNISHEEVIRANYLDLIKIALWFQSRIYPPDVVGGSEVKLAQPFTNEPVQAYPSESRIYWEGRVGKENFNFSYDRVLGLREGHQTNLYVGLNIDLILEDREKNWFYRVFEWNTNVQKAYKELSRRAISQSLIPKLKTSAAEEEVKKEGDQPGGRYTLFAVAAKDEPTAALDKFPASNS